MAEFLKKYKAFIYGLVIQRIIVVVLLYFHFIYIDNTALLSNTLSFIFSWLIISLPIHYYSFLKQHKATSLKLLILIAFFWAIIINDMNSKIIDNPVTFIGLVGIGLSFFSIIAPSYFKKHALIVLGFYVLALGYFYYIRVHTNFNNYFQQEKEIKIILTAPFFVLLLIWFYQQWKWLKTIESKKAKAELSLLKSQINPHFFFNTLNNLYGLIIEKSEDAPYVVLKLSEIMRYTIYMGKEDIIPLKDEIEYLRNYIELHKIRYQKKVDITFSHDGQADYKIAPLLFIIPLENAFKHGVERLTEYAYIHINLKTYNNLICFDIENNFESRESQTPGIGLNNLRQRLKLLYPNKHQMKIDITDSIYKLHLKIEMT
ncbi:histidine kinase [Flavobacterium sp. CFBP9031]|jgi:sensor histidine kinase YesM|uniref:sensor histidine kinase n=1 Tax=Flavobacterium sp. CFBP9031 TaxID=3096538 RepID=UPI002A6A8E16|nr:histidine kinase [Flavobacterium sp. CFBP9031]MDY0986612.1 histidine kinase [Flavobacterium sp. CFBP9031]